MAMAGHRHIVLGKWSYNNGLAHVFPLRLMISKGFYLVHHSCQIIILTYLTLFSLSLSTYCQFTFRKIFVLPICQSSSLPSTASAMRWHVPRRSPWNRWVCMECSFKWHGTLLSLKSDVGTKLRFSDPSYPVHFINKISTQTFKRKLPHCGSL